MNGNVIVAVGLIGAYVATRDGSTESAASSSSDSTEDYADTEQFVSGSNYYGSGGMIL